LDMTNVLLPCRRQRQSRSGSQKLPMTRLTRSVSPCFASDRPTSGERAGAKSYSLQTFHGALPASHNPSSTALSRKVSIGCQKPRCR
jgi:hypothetical protein